MENKALSFLITFLACGLFASSCVKSEEPLIIPDTLTLDDTTYTNEDGRYGRKILIENFLNVAIAANFAKPGATDYSPLSIHSERSGFYHPENFKRNYPWLYPHIYEVKEIPALLTINKWTGPVRISLDLPNNYQSYGEENKAFGYYLKARNKPKPEYSVARSWIEEEASSMASTLSGLTKLDIKFISDEPPNSPLSISNVRIILMDDVSWWETKFKSGNRRRTANLTDWDKSWIALEPHLVTRIPFTPPFTKQVDGYYISNGKNQIQFAVCYIWAGHEEALIKKLTQECLVRSLGFSGFHTTYHRSRVSVLKAWSDPDDQAPVQSNAIAYEPRLTDLDQFFIETLYSPAIKPGMKYMDVFNLLFGNSEDR